MNIKRRFLRGFTIVELLICIVLVAIFIGLLMGSSYFSGSGFFQFPFWIVFGWIGGLFRWLKGLAIEPVALAIGVVAFGLFLYFLHRTIRAFQSDWSIRRSLGLAGIILAVSISAIALICAVHNTYWLKKTETYFEIARGSAYYHLETKNQLKAIGFGAIACQDSQHFVSGGGAVRKEGDLDHSWMTRLLPYLDEEKLYESIHLDKSWLAPENKEAFAKNVFVLQPSRYSRQRHKNWRINEKGYALAGFAVNQCVLPAGSVLNLDEIPDGAANTILLGGVSENYRAWGDPVNARDPRLGLNSNPYGFGNPARNEEVLFGFCDGAVRYLNVKIDPKVLRALAMPNDGEKIDLKEVPVNKER